MLALCSKKRLFAYHGTIMSPPSGESFSQAVLDSLSPHIAVLDRHGVIVAVNRTWREFAEANGAVDVGLGRSYLEVCQMAAGPFSDEAPQAGEGIREVLNGSLAAFQMEYPCDCPARKRWFLLHVTPLSAECGGAVIAHVNITERRQAEELLRRSEEQYRLLAESIPQLVWMTGPDGQIEFANDRCPAYSGVAMEEAQRQDWRQVVHANDLARMNAEWERSRRTGQPYEVEARLRRADGEFRWHIIRAVPLADEQGKITRWFGTCTDIEEQKRAAETLHRDHEFLKTVLETIQDMVIACDRQGTLTLVNRAARVLGYASDQPLPLEKWLNTYKVYHADGKTPKKLEEMPLFRALQGERVENVESVVYLTPERASHFSGSALPLRDAQGQLLGGLLVVHDVTERRRLQEQLVQSQKMEAVGQLASGIAHDFNNLLTVINGYSEVLALQCPPGDPRAELVRSIQRAGERAAGLTRQLLAFSRKQIIAPTVLDLNEVIANLLKMLARLLGEDIELRTNLHPHPALVNADRGQLEQVLLNLTVNARDAMPRGGRLTIETAELFLDEAAASQYVDLRSGPHIVLRVADTGCGMSPEVQARMFEPFFTTKEVGKGTGLGLAMIYGAIKQANGHIEVQSEPGTGTTFQFFLPRAVRSEAKPSSDSTKLLVSPGKETVLLVDDEEGVRALGRHVLQSCGYVVREASNGPEAVRLCRQHPGRIDLLVTDVVMPGGMGGREVADTVRALRPEIKVLYLSGYMDDAIVRYGIEFDRVHFLRKPFSTFLLASKVREVLDAPPSPRDESAAPSGNNSASARPAEFM